MRSCSCPLKGLSEEMSVHAGHDADQIIMKEWKDMVTDPHNIPALLYNIVVVDFPLKLLQEIKRQAKNYAPFPD
ncbi:MAG: hypothetical protein MUC31_02375 [Bacteroidales bacterium]|nr:hypothetical protein [Bacteroidales bacterium]